MQISFLHFYSARCLGHLVDGQMMTGCDLMKRWVVAIYRVLLEPLVFAARSERQPTHSIVLYQAASWEEIGDFVRWLLHD